MWYTETKKRKRGVFLKTAGIIAEYNPMHNGHAYQLSQTNADVTVVVMSGNFVQRGEPALRDKFARAKYAILNGASLVLELPYDFAVASAERFAFGGVYILNALGGIDEICFGAESPLNQLKAAAKLLRKEKMDAYLKSADLKDMPYHEFRNEILKDNPIIKKPNNILAIEYLKALDLLQSDIKPRAIPRTGAGHDESAPHGAFASASFIRNKVLEGFDVSPYIPSPLPNEKNVCLEDFYPILRSRILTESPESLSEIAEIREGIENRIIEAALTAKSAEELIEKVKTKRYTRTAISRMLIHILLNTKKNDLSAVPQYTRVLAADEKGRAFLNKARKTANIQIVTKGSAAPECEEFKIDVRAGNLYSMVQDFNGDLNRDYTEKPFMILGGHHPDTNLKQKTDS